MMRKNHSGFLLVLLVLWGLLAVATVMPSRPRALAAGQPPFKVLKDQAWAQQWPPLAPASALAPGRLRQMHLFPLLAQSYPYPTDYWTRIVFQSNTDAGWDIFVMTPYWGGLRRITYHAAADFTPTASWEALQIAFVSQRDDNDEIYRVDLNGDHLQRLTNNPTDDFHPAWAPGKGTIAFVRDIDGQEDIFRMSADGSGVMRLTTNTDRDLSPAWSPDGQKIVWAKRQGAAAALWVMHADGSDPHALTPALPYLQHPRWSPQGDRIAFDYDADGDGYNELAMMKPDGSDLHTVFDANTDLVDLWLGDWSPQGDRLLFSVVLYVIVDNKLYIQDSVIGFRSLDGHKLYMFDPRSNAAEMLPVWRKLDHQAPMSSMDALPAWGPAPFKVQWHGQDQGVSGIATYDVQVREGTDGEWRTWLAHEWSNDDYYPGIGGHSYYFRVRARDRAGNVQPWPEGWQAGTTVEDLPPQSTMQPLQSHERKDPLLQWSASDSGGSAIAGYDVQYRPGEGGAWTDWFTRTWTTQAYFPAETGVHTYFRVRAHDSAENVESWPQGDGNTATIVYGWKLAGTMSDAREQPVPGVQTLTMPAGFEAHATDASGVFTVYGHSGVDDIVATWQKPGYGELPPTHYTTAEDIDVAMVLPPFDNQVRNGDFETALAPPWFKDVQSLQVVTDTAHTGETSLLLGCTTPALAPLEVLSDTAQSGYVDNSIVTQFVVDDAGTVHLLQARYVRENGQSKRVLVYKRRERTGAWTAAEQVLHEALAVNSVHMAVDHHGILHVVMAEGSYPHHILYLSRSPTGTWSTPQFLSDASPYQGDAGIVVDSKDTVHVIWLLNNAITYTSRPAGGNWTEATQIASFSQSWYPLRVMLDDNDGIHVELGSYTILYLKRDPDGTWSQKQEIGHAGSGLASFAMRADGRGGIHFLWSTNGGGQVFYAFRRPDGSIAGPFRVDGAHPVMSFRPALLAVTRDGRVHIVWRYSYISQTGLIYLQKRPDGSWTQDRRLPYDGDPKALLLDDQGRLHLAWQNSMGIQYAQRGTREDWSTPVSVYRSSVPLRVRLAQEADGRLHFLLAPLYGGAVYRYTHTLFQDWPARTYSASQQVSVPAASAQPTLSLFYRFQQAAGLQPSVLQELVDDGVQAAAPISVTASTGDWQHGWADMTPWAGKTVTLTLRLQQAAASLCAQAFVDELSLGSYVFPDLWIRGAGEVAAPGESVRLVISYGNQGDAPAVHASITTTLPLSLTLLAADPAPEQDGALLRWDVGDLGAHSGPFGIVYTATVAVDIISPRLLSQPLRIAGETAEPFTADNMAVMSTFVGGYQRYWPLLLSPAGTP